MTNAFFFFSSRRRHTRYWRDWSSDVCSSDLMRDDVPGILRAQRLGYAVVSHDFDPHDWAYASGERTGEIPLPPLGEQDDITVLLHDAGGTDRSLTLAYVERLIGQRSEERRVGKEC